MAYKRLRSVVFFAIILSLSSLFGDSRDVSEFDGNDWNEMDETLKIGYVKGFIAGTIFVIEENIHPRAYALRAYKNPEKGKKKYHRILGARDTLSTVFTSSDGKWAVAYEQYSRNERLYRYTIYGITVGQIVDGLDELYEDFKNRSIKVQDAMYLIKKQIKGAPEEEVRQLLIYLRGDKKSLDALWARDEQGKRKYLISFP